MSRAAPAPTDTWTRVVRRLRDRRSWRVAMVVGTLISLYGQLLVPWLSGEIDVVTGFVERARLHPATTGLSVLLAYAFPLGVSAWSAATAGPDPEA